MYEWRYVIVRFDEIFLWATFMFCVYVCKDMLTPSVKNKKIVIAWILLSGIVLVVGVHINLLPGWFGQESYETLEYAEGRCELSLFQQESHFRMDAVSPVGAIGLAQLMPETAAGLGGNPLVLEENVRCGVEYLGRQLDRFSYAGELQATYAVAAYNAGPQRILDYGDVPPYWETRNHVNAVAENYRTISAILQNEA